MAEGNQRGAQLGEQIGGYRLMRRLGDGSTSTVFLGEHVRLGRPAAIKVLTADVTDDPRTIERLLHEARVVNDIRHPNIVDIWDFVEQVSPRRVALVMEHIEGPSLETFRGDPLPPAQALALCLQLVDAVQAAHARGVIHRDLKPANLLLTFDPAEAPEVPLEVRVVDFGIAKSAGPHGQGMTVSGTILGTPAYMAPEQIAGSPAPSPATDVFALGAVIYELLSGKRAYPSKRLQETVRMKLRGERPELPAPEMPGAGRLVALVLECLARQPSARPGLDAVRERLDRLLRTAAGEHMTDALALPTLGLTAATALPQAATELSEIPFGAIEALRKSAPAELPGFDDEDEDDEEEDDTVLARDSLEMDAMDFATEQASAQAPAWASSQRDVATGMAVDALPEALSNPTNPGFAAEAHDLPEPDTAERQRGLLAPVGVQSLGPDLDNPTRTFPKFEAIDDGLSTEPPQVPATPTRAQRAPEDAPSPPPDQVFASGVGLEEPVPETVKLPPKLMSPSPPEPEPEPSGGRGGLALAVILVLLALGLGGAAWVAMARDEAPEPAPVSPTQPPNVRPSATPIAD